MQVCFENASYYVYLGCDYVSDACQKIAAFAKKVFETMINFCCCREKQTESGIKPIELLVPFYSAKGADIEGRTFDSILAQNDDWLEKQHDYIQWLFPTKAQSRFNKKAPVIDDATAPLLYQNPHCKANVKRAFSRMLAFYGLQKSPDNTNAITRSVHFKERSAVWLTSHNHNFSRISRILQCLTAFGMGDTANAFRKVLSDICEKEGREIIPTETRHFWGIKL